MRGAVIVRALWCAAALATEPPIVITGATVIDRRDFGRSAVDRRNTVLIDDGRIAAVGRRVRIPPNAQRVEGNGLFLVPGYIDRFSAQANRSFANAHLYMGVTSAVVGLEGDPRRGRTWIARRLPARGSCCSPSA